MDGSFLIIRAEKWWESVSENNDVGEIINRHTKPQWTSSYT